MKDQPIMCPTCRMRIWLTQGHADHSERQICADRWAPLVAIPCRFCSAQDIPGCECCAGTGVEVDRAYGPPLPEDLDHPFHQAMVDVAVLSCF